MNVPLNPTSAPAAARSGMPAAAGGVPAAGQFGTALQSALSAEAAAQAGCLSAAAGEEPAPTTAEAAPAQPVPLLVTPSLAPVPPPSVSPESGQDSGETVPAALAPACSVAAGTKLAGPEPAGPGLPVPTAADVFRQAGAGPEPAAVRAPLPAAGPAPAQQAATAVPVPLAAQLRGPVAELVRAAAGQHIVTVHVAPENMGPVTVQAHIGGGSLRVELFSSTDAGREALRAILPELRRDLAATGNLPANAGGSAAAQLNTTLELSAQSPPEPRSGPADGAASGGGTAGRGGDTGQGRQGSDRHPAGGPGAPDAESLRSAAPHPPARGPAPLLPQAASSLDVMA